MAVQSNQYNSLGYTSGWVVFAGTVTLLAAAANLLYGIVLLVNDDWVALTREGLIRFDTTTAGVVFLIFTGLQVLVAFGIFTGQLWARILGIIGASLGILSQMAFLSIYPAWAWLVIIVDGLVIYGLAVHGDEVAQF
ncbi:MAG: hypothetical protein OEV40_14340 [Acidimicrobiia bacterium]|nr:hypothetical protein [Acidimicrobiia bacterium]